MTTVERGLVSAVLNTFAISFEGRRRAAETYSPNGAGNPVVR